MAIPQMALMTSHFSVHGVFYNYFWMWLHVIDDALNLIFERRNSFWFIYVSPRFYAIPKKKMEFRLKMF